MRSALTRPAAAVILLAAFAARVLWLPELPPGLGRDEAYYAVDAASVLREGPRVYYAGNGGREGLFMALAAPFIAAAGHDPFALRLPAAFAGVVFVAALFAFARRLFRRDALALVAAAFAAGAVWLIVENRIGWRLNLFAPLLAIAGYWFWRALETRRTGDWLAAGAAFGLAQYSYSAVRALPPVIPGYLVLLALVGRSPQLLWERRREWLAFALAAAAVAMPLALYVVTNPGVFFERQLALMTNDGRLAGGHGYVGRLAGMLRMFFLEGVSSPLQSYPGDPAFTPVGGALFVGGLAVALRRLREPAFQFILLWLAVFTLAAALPRDAAPHFIHGAGVLPVLFLFPALGLVAAVDGARRLGRQTAARLAAGAAAVIVAGNFAWGWNRYFSDYRALPGLAAAYDADLVDVANAMNDRSRPATAIVIPIGAGYLPGWSHPTVEFLYRGDAPFRFLRIDEASVAAELAALAGERREVTVIELSRARMAPPDTKQIVDFLLRRQWQLVHDEAHASYRLASYRLDEPLWPALAPDGEQPAALEFGRTLRLERWAAGPSAARDRLWALARWSLLAPTDHNLKVSLRLRDEEGRLVAQADRDLLAPPRFVPTAAWPVGERQASYHLLDLPPGLPAGRYRLHATVYDRESGEVLRVRDAMEGLVGVLTLPPSGTALDPELAVANARWGGIALAGRALPDSPVIPGETAAIVLYWQRLPGPVVGAGYEVHLLDSAGNAHGGGRGVPLGGRLPPASWPDRALVRDVVEARLAVTAPAGPLAVDVQWGEGPAARVGTLQVAGRERRFTPPPFVQPVGETLGGIATLLGWSSWRLGSELQIELVWQAAATPDRNWSVFVHLVGPDGRIAAQRDGPPGGGEAPAVSWLPGEVLIDRRTLSAPAGPLRLVVGLYDPVTGERARSPAGDALELGVLP
ncbi:MAG: glycosyltransferase family 39 protein [Chloroflexota bacterium]|nr:glycosyltransferase family 39 protein [Chloroflexota bacterium]